jgi:hypothetical protein
MSSMTLRILLVAALVLVAFAVLMSAAYAQTGTATPMATTVMSITATPGTLPRTGAADSAASTATVMLLALGATAGLGGLLLRGLRQPR